MLSPHRPALVLAPMDGVTDAAMRDYQGLGGAFSYAVSEFVRVSVHTLPPKVFRREIPEVLNGGRTRSGLPVQVQILGGDEERMALTAVAAVRAGAQAIDINFGCPAPAVNRHDGGASLLRSPCRIRSVVTAIRGAVPEEIPVSAKLRLGWESITEIHENAAMAAEGGANWLTIHARTKMQGYRPPVFWPEIGRVRRALGIPIIANGDIWNRDDFHLCQDETGCQHFMIGRGTLADPQLPFVIATELGLRSGPIPPTDWVQIFSEFLAINSHYRPGSDAGSSRRLKQWMSLAHQYGTFPHFHILKEEKTASGLLQRLADLSGPVIPDGGISHRREPELTAGSPVAAAGR